MESQPEKIPISEFLSGKCLRLDNSFSLSWECCDVKSVLSLCI